MELVAKHEGVRHQLRPVLTTHSTNMKTTILTLAVIAALPSAARAQAAEISTSGLKNKLLSTWETNCRAEASSRFEEVKTTHRSTKAEPPWIIKKETLRHSSKGGQ